MSTITPSQVNSPEQTGLFESIRNWNLATKLLAIILLAVLVPQLIAAAINFPIARDQAISNVGEEVMAVRSESAAASVSQFLTAKCGNG